MIVAKLILKGTNVAEITYRAGQHVEVRVTSQFEEQNISFPLQHSENDELKGVWADALDSYFNEGLFESKDNLFPGEMRRTGCARDHKTLFRQAAHALHKDLGPHGYHVVVEFI